MSFNLAKFLYSYLPLLTYSRLYQNSIFCGNTTNILHFLQCKIASFRVNKSLYAFIQLVLPPTFFHNSLLHKSIIHTSKSSNACISPNFEIVYSLSEYSLY